MPGRSFSSGSYRYGFNGKENDNEVKGQGNQQDYGARIYDSRLGRFLSVDPIMVEYPWYSPYQFSGNSPIRFIDRDGLEPATPEQKQKAVKLLHAYKNAENVTKVFSQLNRGIISTDLMRQLSNPESSTMPQGGSYYCGLFAFAYAFQYYDPEAFTKGVLDLMQKGKTSINGTKITASSSFREMKIDANVSLLMFSSAVRENQNLVFDASDRHSLWASTASGSMKSMLKEIGNLNVKEFSYGHESAMDGIKTSDISILKTHLERGNLAVVRVGSRAFQSKEGDVTFDPGASLVMGDHWIVLSGITNFDEKNNSITINYYDSHGSGEKTFSLNSFKDFIFHVMMVEKNEAKKDSNE